MIGDRYKHKRTGRRFQVKAEQVANKLVHLEETHEPKTNCPYRWVSNEELATRYQRDWSAT